MKTSADFTGSRPQMKIQAWLPCLFPVVSVLGAFVLISLPGRNSGLGKEGVPRTTEISSTETPPVETRQLLEHDLAVNGPLPVSFSGSAYSSAAPAYWVTGKSAREAPGHRSTTIWAADRSDPARRAIDEEKTGELLFFSSSAEQTTQTPHTPVLSVDKAISRAQEFLCYFRKTEWSSCPIEMRKDLAPSEGIWCLLIRRKDRVIQMTIQKQTGNLLYLAVLPARKRPSQIL